MASGDTEVLPNSRAALAQARRVLDELAQREGSREAYRDQVPYALDRLDNVWRTIDGESQGQRTHEFGAWWKKQNTQTRDSVKRLRNAELKEGIVSTRLRMRFRMPGHVRINEDKSITILHEDGTEVPPAADGTLVTPVAHLTETRWDFNVPGLKDRPAQEVLETVYTLLAEKVLPKAERLLSGSAE